MTVATFNATTAQNVWLNNDGLVVKFGTTEGRIDTGGEIEARGLPWLITELRLNPVTDLTSTSGTLLGTGVNTELPAGAIIQQVEIISEVACTSGGSAVINLGTATVSNLNVVANNNILNAIALSTINGDGKYQNIQVGSTGAGTLIGNKNGVGTSAVTLIADNGGTVFTAGKLVIRIYYYNPDSVQ